ncbi:MAG: CCA tRNA nucleotidyltransferase [bacterium]
MKEYEKLIKKFDAVLRERLVFDLAEKMIKKIPKAEVYLVGGAVRDVILGRPVKDIDILVRKVSPADLEKFLKTQGKVDLVGKRFSVLKFTPKTAGLLRGVKPRTELCSGARARNDGAGEATRQIDIALPRTDFSYGTGGYKDVKVKSDPNLAVEEDLARRDFTVNAMAWNVLEKKIIDPYGGLLDLKKKIIRTVGLPKERFGEDYSRMLRAVRFAMQLDFKIESNTRAAIKKYIGRINDLTPTSPLGLRGAGGDRKVPYEVIVSEFLKSFSVAPRKTIETYFDCGAIKKLMPELLTMKKCSQPKEHHSEGDVLTHTLIALDNINSKMFKKYFPEPVSLTAKVAILLHDIGKPKSKKKMDGRTVFYNHDKIGAGMAKNFLERLKFSAPPDIGIDAEEVVWLVGNHLLFFYSPPEQMKKTTLEKYLFNKRFSGLSHMQLFLADATATKPEKIKLDLTRFKKAYELWRSFQKTEKLEMPKPFLNGDEVMKILKIAPGPKVGDILNLLREEQLNGRVKTKKDAEKFIKK